MRITAALRMLTEEKLEKDEEKRKKLGRCWDAHRYTHKLTHRYGGRHSPERGGRRGQMSNKRQTERAVFANTTAQQWSLLFVMYIHIYIYIYLHERCVCKCCYGNSRKIAEVKSNRTK